MSYAVCSMQKARQEAVSSLQREVSITQLVSAARISDPSASEFAKRPLHIERYGVPPCGKFWDGMRFAVCGMWFVRGIWFMESSPCIDYRMDIPMYS